MTYSQRKQNFLSRIWGDVSGYFTRRFAGSQRPLATQPQISQVASYITRDYDLEIPEWPIRDRERALILMDMRSHCPEIGTAISYIKDDVVSSADGDDQEITIGPVKNEKDEAEEATLDSEVEEIGKAVLARCFKLDEIPYVVDKILSYGDCFANLSVNLAERQIDGLLFLPTWELFRVEDNGLLRFEQRRWLGQTEGAIQMHPITVVHWRYNRLNLYGRALFEECKEDWGRLKDASMDVASASRDVGINPIVHAMPEGVKKDTRDAYIRDHEQKLANGIITHYYPWGGIDVKRMSENNPDINALIDNHREWRSRIVMQSRVPAYLFGLHDKGAKDIAGQPAMAYSRFINRVRGCVGVGIRQVIDTELALKGIPKERWVYRIAWPKFATTLADQANTQADDTATDEDQKDGAKEEKKQNRNQYLRVVSHAS